MYIAKQGQTLIDLSRHNLLEVRELKARQGFTCPFCYGDLHLKSGPKVRPHFAHVAECTYAYHENESVEHLEAKVLMKDWLMGQKIPAVLEKAFPAIKRVADIFFKYHGRDYVIEIQKSSQSSVGFKERTESYHRLNITVIWLFIGDVRQKAATFKLDRTMAATREPSLFHLDLEGKKLTGFQQVTWLTAKEVQAAAWTKPLGRLLLGDLLFPKKGEGLALEKWLLIKRDFRMRKWQGYMRSERLLARTAARHRSNLSLIPAEVGWPVSGGGFQKPLFIWQACILHTIMAACQPGDALTLGELVRKLGRDYQLTVDAAASKQLGQYLQVLHRLKIISLHDGYLEYLKVPAYFQRLEEALEADAVMGSDIL